MFGFSFSELVVVVVVALVVIGPKDLPKMLRRLGQWSGKLRRMAADLRAQSGIDDALRSEGLTDDINEIRKLARGEIDAVQRAARIDDGPSRAPARIDAPASAYLGDFYVAREREYPRDGADAFGALPDNAIVYVEGLPKSALGRDPLYVTGDPNGVLPPEPPKATFGYHDGETPDENVDENHGENHGESAAAESADNAPGADGAAPEAASPAAASSDPEVGTGGRPASEAH